jgi:hypothetical protein
MNPPWTSARCAAHPEAAIVTRRNWPQTPSREWFACSVCGEPVAAPPAPPPGVEGSSKLSANSPPGGITTRLTDADEIAYLRREVAALRASNAAPRPEAPCACVLPQEEREKGRCTACGRPIDAATEDAKDAAWSAPEVPREPWHLVNQWRNLSRSALGPEVREAYATCAQALEEAIALAAPPPAPGMETRCSTCGAAERGHGSAGNIDRPHDFSPALREEGVPYEAPLEVEERPAPREETDDLTVYRRYVPEAEVARLRAERDETVKATRLSVAEAVRGRDEALAQRDAARAQVESLDRMNAKLSARVEHEKKEADAYWTALDKTIRDLDASRAALVALRGRVEALAVELGTRDPTGSREGDANRKTAAALRRTLGGDHA